MNLRRRRDHYAIKQKISDQKQKSQKQDKNTFPTKRRHGSMQ